MVVQISQKSFIVKPQLLLTGLMLLGISCTTDPATNDWIQFDLSDYNVPIQIIAPDSVEVETSEMSSVVRDIIVTDRANYQLQIFTSPALTQSVEEVRNSQQQIIRENPYFQQFLEVEEDRFLYELNIDDQQVYGFRRIFLVDKLEITVQNGLGTLLSQEEALRMLSSIQRK